MSIQTPVQYVHRLEDVIYIGDEVIVRGLEVEEVKGKVYEAGWGYSTTWSSSRLLNYIFTVESIGEVLVLSDGSNFFIPSNKVTLERVSDGKVVKECDFKEASPDYTSGGLIDTTLKPIPEAEARDNEKVIPTQRVTTNTSPESFKEASEGVKDNTKEVVICPIARKVAEKISERAKGGFNKYGVTADRDDLSIIEWLTHAQEEAMDLAVYLEKIKKEIGGG